MIVNTLSWNYHLAVNDLAGYVQRRRADLGLTQAELAARCGLERDYIAQVESRKSKLPIPDNRRKLAKGLGVSHMDLLVAAGELTEAERGGVVHRDPESPVEQIVAMVRSLNDDQLLNLRRFLRYLTEAPDRTMRVPPVATQSR